MRGVVLISHGDFAKGISSSIEMVLGNTDNLFVLSLEENEGLEQLTNKFDLLEEDLEKYNNIIIFADILGGTPCNSALLKYAENPKYEIIAGMNLPMIIEALLGDANIEDIIDAGKNAIVDVKKQVDQID